MKILLLAPQPFFQVRGTPIAIDLLVSTLSKQGHSVDLVTYHEGEARQYDRVNHYRIREFKILNGVQPGFSLKKLLCSGLLMLTALKLVRKNSYDHVLANEESVFIAYLYEKIFKLPYVYDMDSSLANQIIDKMPALRIFSWPLAKLETVAIRNSIGVLAVCEALCKIARPHNSNVQLLTDVAMLDHLDASDEVEQLGEKYSLTGTRLMYIGNLETYQGIDLLLKGFALAIRKTPQLNLIIIGGSKTSIESYREQCKALGIIELVVFTGPKPFSDIEAYMQQTDILVSPRTQGENTPMKIYNYMASGKPIIATDIYSHTQVLNENIAVLVEVNAAKLATAIVQLAESKENSLQLGERCRAHTKQYYSVESYEQKVAGFFHNIEAHLFEKN